MVKRCEATTDVNKGLMAVIMGRPLPTFPEIEEHALTVRCENPLGHREKGHRGSHNDSGRFVHTWGMW